MIKKIIVLFLFVTAWCYGYIDPGAGSYLIQILIAAFLGAAFGIKVFWKKIIGFFRKSVFKNKPKQAEDE